MKTALLPKKGILPLILVLILLPAGLCSCGSKKDVPAVHLAQELSAENIEWTTLPWFSDTALAVEKFRLQPNGYVVRNLTWSEPQKDREGFAQNLWGLQLTFPVYLKDLKTDAVLNLTYAYDGGKNRQGIANTRLTRMSLKVYFPDERAKEACVQRLWALMEALEEKGPEIYRPIFTDETYDIINRSCRQGDMTYSLFTSPVFSLGLDCPEGLILSLTAEEKEELYPFGPQTVPRVSFS